MEDNENVKINGSNNNNGDSQSKHEKENDKLPVESKPTNIM